VVLTPEEVHKLVSDLPEAYSLMAKVAMCTGLRISEVLALRWEHIDFEADSMLVQQGLLAVGLGKPR
jgi:integrase